MQSYFPIKRGEGGQRNYVWPPMNAKMSRGGILGHPHEWRDVVHGDCQCCSCIGVLYSRERVLGTN